VTLGWLGRLGAWVVRFAMAVIAGNKLTPPDHRQYNSFHGIGDGSQGDFHTDLQVGGGFDRLSTGAQSVGE
jgi:hypothetical protein